MKSSAAANLLIRCIVTILAVGLATTVSTADDAAVSPAAKVTFDLSKGHAMADNLWGVFFEEVCFAHRSDHRHCSASRTLRVGTNTAKQALVLQIQHAGEGGVYAELINDRSFGGLACSLGLAYSLALSHTEATHLPVPTSSFENEYLPFAPNVGLFAPNQTDAHLTGIQRWRSTAPPEYR